MATFTNRALLRYEGGTVSSNSVTGELRDPLSAAKTTAGTTYRVGDVLTYVISLQNGGTAGTGDLSLTDDLGAYALGPITVTPLSYVAGSLLYYLNGVLQPTPAVVAGPPLVISGINIPAGGNAVLIYRALVGEGASPLAGSSITNTAVILGTCAADPITVSTTVTIEEGVDLTIEKSLCPASVACGDRLTYTFTINNYGNTAACVGEGIVLSDTFNPILHGITVTLNGVPLVEGVDYTYNEATGEFATTAGLITLPAATFTQDPLTGDFTTEPGTATLVVSGTL